MKRVIALLVCLVTMSMLSGCGTEQQPQGKAASSQTKLKVVASFYPMQEFVKRVGGDKVEVAVLVPAGVEPHDWEPTPKDVMLVQNAKLFVYNGAGMEHWVPKMLETVNNKPGLVILETTKNVPMLEDVTDQHDHGHEHKQQEHKSDSNKQYDPHVWLDLVLAQQQVNAIRDALCEIDSANKADYEANAASFNKELQALHTEFEQSLSKANTREFVATHNAFGYVAKRYQLEQIAIMGISPDSEPKPAEMAKLIEEVKKHRIQYIFFETLVSPKVAETIAASAGAKTLVLDPIEGLTKEEIAKGENYVTVMKKNLGNLKLALGVQ